MNFFAILSKISICKRVLVRFLIYNRSWKCLQKLLVLWEESSFWILSSTISFRILIHQLVPFHSITSLKLSNRSLSRLEAQMYSSMSYLKNKYKPLLTISFPLAMCMLELLPSGPTLCNPVDCSPPGSSVHGILQPRILEYVAMPSSTGSSWSRDRTLDPGSCLLRLLH